MKKLGVSTKVGAIDGLTNIITYYINQKERGWVQQTMLIRVYIEMKMEVTTCRGWDEEKKHDAFVCVYCKWKFSSKLHINDHQIQGCPNGPLDANGVKISLLSTRTYNMHNNSRTSRINLEALLMILCKNIGRLKSFSMNLTHNFESIKNQTRMIQ